MPERRHHGKVELGRRQQHLLCATPLCHTHAILACTRHHTGHTQGPTRTSYFMSIVFGHGIVTHQFRLLSHALNMPKAAFFMPFQAQACENTVSMCCVCCRTRLSRPVSPSQSDPSPPSFSFRPPHHSIYYIVDTGMTPGSMCSAGTCCGTYTWQAYTGMVVACYRHA